MYPSQNLKINLIHLLKKSVKLTDFIFTTIAVQLLNFYKLVISPYMGWNCRFYPTCSSYSLEAYQKFNFITATYMTFKRLLNCRPFGKEGYDPVECCSEKQLNWSKHG